MSLSIALAQVQLKPQYHPSYSADPQGQSGRPLSNLRVERKKKLHAIVLALGASKHGDILDEMRKTDPKINKDDARKMLDELCDDKRMDKRTVYGGGKKVFYTARPA